MERDKQTRMTNLTEAFINLGIKPDYLQKEIYPNHSIGDALLYGERTPLLQVKQIIGGIQMHLDGKLRAEFSADDKVKLHFISVHSQLQIPDKLMDFELKAEHKKALKEEGHLGEVANINTHKAYISVDKETNTLVSTLTHKVYVPEKILNKELSDKEFDDLKAGKPIELRGLINKQGETFDAKITVDASKRGLAFKALAGEGQDLAKENLKTLEANKPAIQKTEKSNLTKQTKGRDREALTKGEIKAETPKIKPTLDQLAQTKSPGIKR